MAKELNVEELLTRYPHRFESKPFYSSDGDCIQWYFEDVDSYAERIDCWLTVRKAFDDERLVGFKLKNVRALMQAFEALGLHVVTSGKRWIIRLRTFVACSPTVAGVRPNAYRDVVRRIPVEDTLEVPV
jgi:hypothetical protein